MCFILPHYNPELDIATEIQWPNSDGPLFWYQNFCNPDGVERLLSTLNEPDR